MEALATRGPLYVALDASQPTFKFYSEGIYHSDTCYTDRDDLDHAVLLVGYGTSESGGLVLIEGLSLGLGTAEHASPLSCFTAPPRHIDRCGLLAHPQLLVQAVGR